MASRSFNTSSPTPDKPFRTIDPDGFEIPSDDLECDEARVRAGFFPTLKRAFAYMPFADDVVASYYCALDRRTPARVRGILLGALLYFIMPFDAIPDFLVGFGFTDDVSVLATAIYMVRQHVTPEHRARAREAIDTMREE